MFYQYLVISLCSIQLSAGILNAQSKPEQKKDTVSKGEIVFSVPIGSSDNQLGVFLLPPDRGIDSGLEEAGPEKLIVNDKGYYVLDRVNQCIKAFDKTGKFLLKTEGKLISITSFLVDNAGNIYVETPEEKLIKYDPSGKILWEKWIQEIVKEKWDDIFLANGNSIVFVLDTKPSSLAIVDGEGKHIRTVSGSRTTDDGKVYWIQKVENWEGAMNQWRYRFSVSSLIDENTSEFTMKINNPSSPMLKGLDNFNLGTLIVVSGGGIYFHRAVGSDNLLLKYDGKDGLDAVLRYPSDRFEGIEAISIDKNGNLYHLETGDKAVNIVRYKTH